MGRNPVSCLSDNVSVDKEKCIGCGTCMEHCILDNLRLLQAPCFAACPLEINPQSYVQLTARGDIPGALAKLYERTPFIGILGSVCNHICEAQCNRNKLDKQAVMIRDIKKYLFSQRGENKPPMNKKESRKMRVAIVGGGPAGMQAAWDLLQEGYAVTLFEGAEKLGGVLRNSIPIFRMEEAVLDAEAELLVQLGAEILCNRKIGAEELTGIVAEYDAVFLATGASKPVMFPELQAENVISALQFLQNARKGCAQLGQDVLVVGGGDVAMDAALTAKKAGAKTVRIVCLENHGELPASKEETEQAEQAGVSFLCGWGLDEARVENGILTGIRVKQCIEVFDAKGHFSPRYCADVVQDVGCDQMIVAVGQQADLSYLQKTNIQAGNRVEVNPVSMQTATPNVFAGGDIVPGPNTVVNAMADGKRAAESIHKYLQEDDLVYGRGKENRYIEDFEVELSSEVMVGRVALAAREEAPTARRALTAVECKEQATRCLNCGHPIGFRKTCWMCLPCEVVCPQDALQIKVHYIMA